MRHAVTLALVLSSLAACGPGGRNDGTGGDDDGSGSGSGSGSSNGENCSDSAKFIYTIDSSNEFSRFDASTKTFTRIGDLNCPSSGQPFSMSVDRNTVAWVLYNDGGVYRVDINNNLACSATNWSSQSNLLEFGMGFSSNTAGSTDDTLFVAGGATVSSGSSTLATLDTTTMQATTIGTVQGSPELTGNGNAELWGWFPDSTNPRVEQINKANGAPVPGKTYSLPALAGEPLAWAFAFWGGDYWVFLERSDDFGFPEAPTSVYQVDGTNGTIKSTTPTSDKEIVGAGVSTCAPVIIL